MNEDEDATERSDDIDKVSKILMGMGDKNTERDFVLNQNRTGRP